MNMFIKQEVMEEPNLQSQRFEGGSNFNEICANHRQAATAFTMKIKSEISDYSTGIQDHNSISIKLEPFTPVKHEELFITQSELQSITRASQSVNDNRGVVKLELPVIDEIDIKEEAGFPETRGLQNQTSLASRKVRKRPQPLKKLFICHHCGYQTNLKRLIVKHIRAHAGLKPYACNKCLFRTRRKGHLTRHMKIHSGEKPYVCPQCDYRTADKQNHQRHLLVHTGEKPYRCRECGFRAADKSWFNQHLFTHGGDKSYVCSDCPYRTASKSHLTRHQRSHTGERPFACDECPFRAADKSTLTKHARCCHEKKRPQIGKQARTEVKFEVPV